MTILSLYSDWTHCSACQLPRHYKRDDNDNDDDDDDNDDNDDKKKNPKVFLKLLVCSRCKSAAYHNAKCQQYDWKSRHKRDCKEWQCALSPLNALICWSHEMTRTDGRHRRHGRHCRCCFWWWREVPVAVKEDCDRQWRQSVRQWEQEEYLVAMRGFQDALEPYRRAWSVVTCSSGVIVDHHDDRIDAVNAVNAGDGFMRSSLTLAKRLLFCAYCELDGGQIDAARQRLVQCLSILMLLTKDATDDVANNATNDATDNAANRTIKDTVSEIMSDAWMELVLSLEEVPRHRLLARHAAQMAIATNSCSWNHPLQRPGYMAPTHLRGTPFTPPSHHPPWCQILERHWKDILNEYQHLANHSTKGWFDVGSGKRGSGHNDHRVVSGQRWTEYVLFGTGSSSSSSSSCNDQDAPVTKRLLRNHLPESINLAERGGGEIIFSRLSPHTRIESHCGTTNLRWTAHLGLIIPSATTTSSSSSSSSCTNNNNNNNACQIRIGSQWHSWKQGKILLFDDSYEHEVRNDTNHERVVLLIRTWHPDLCHNSDLVSKSSSSISSCCPSTREQFLIQAMQKKQEAIQKRYHPP